MKRNDAENSRQTAQKKSRSTSALRLPQRKSAVRILSSMTWQAVAGFSLCQTWNILCVALPDPITYAQPFIDLRWVSLSTALALMVSSAILHDRMDGLLRKRSFLYTIGAVAAAGSILGPLSALCTTAAKPLIYLSAVAVGVGFAFLFLAWFVEFCRLHDMMGLAASMVVTAVLTYPLANMLTSNQMNTWVAAAIGSLLPLLSVVALHHTLKFPSKGVRYPPAPPDHRRKLLFLRYCMCLFVVVSIIETVRNLLLNGNALSFYAGIANLGGLTLKIACSVWLLSIFHAYDARGVSIVYRTAFILMLGVVLCIPFLLAGNWIAHTLLDMSGFFFQLTMVMIAYQISIGFSLSPVMVFSTTRAAWALAALVGIGLEGLVCSLGPGTVQLLAVFLGLSAAIIFTFVFTDRDCIEALSSLSSREHTPRFKTKCERLSRRYGISERELEVMTLTAKGRSAARVAEDLNVTLATANSHIHHIYQKLGIHSRQELLDLIESERTD